MVTSLDSLAGSLPLSSMVSFSLKKIITRKTKLLLHCPSPCMVSPRKRTRARKGFELQLQSILRDLDAHVAGDCSTIQRILCPHCCGHSLFMSNIHAFVINTLLVCPCFDFPPNLNMYISHDKHFKSL